MNLQEALYKAFSLSRETENELRKSCEVLVFLHDDNTYSAALERSHMTMDYPIVAVVQNFVPTGFVLPD